MDSTPSTTVASAARDGGSVVLRNTLYLTGAQVLMLPLSMLINAVMGRYLGAAEFGDIYLATTMASFAFLLVEGGHQGVLPAVVARDHRLSGQALGTSLVWRLTLSLVAGALLTLGCKLFGYPPSYVVVVALACLGAALTALVAACKDAIRGFERTDIPAYAQVGQQLVTVALVIPVLMLGARANGVLIVQALAAALVLVPILRTLRPVGITRLTFDRETLRMLVVGGAPFVVFNLTMVLQPNIDAVYLSRLAPAEVMGWHAAARRLIGVLLFPASALIGALYPTLCRLHSNDPAGYARTASGSLRTVGLVVMPIALGCACYPELGITLFSRRSFGPAEDNLRVMSAFLLLVYVSMPLGTCLLAAGRQRAWSAVQALCVAVSLVLDPLLIPYFQRRTGNGGIALCVAAVLSELIVVVAGVVMMPKNVFDAKLGRSLAMALVSGGAMAAAAYALRPLSPFLAAPLAVGVYAVALRVTGAVGREEVAAARSFVMRKLSRGRPAG